MRVFRLKNAICLTRHFNSVWEYNDIANSMWNFENIKQFLLQLALNEYAFLNEPDLITD